MPSARPTAPSEEKCYQADVLVDNDARRDGTGNHRDRRGDNPEQVVDYVLVAFGSGNHPEHALTEKCDTRHLGQRLQNYDKLVHPLNPFILPWNIGAISCAAACSNCSGSSPKRLLPTARRCV